MHQLLSLKMKIWIIVGLAALVSAGAQVAGFTTLSLGAVVGIIELILIQLLMRSWRAVTWAKWLPRPAWARVDLSGEWHGTIQSQWKKNPLDALLAPIPTQTRTSSELERGRVRPVH